MSLGTLRYLEGKDGGKRESEKDQGDAEETRRIGGRDEEAKTIQRNNKGSSCKFVERS